MTSTPPETSRPSSLEPLGDRAAEAVLGANPFVALDGFQILAAAGRLAERAVRKPELLADRGWELSEEVARILFGRSEVAPEARDRRFTDATWRENPVYRRWLQTYLAVSRSLHSLVDDVELDWKSRERGRFALSLLTEAAAPTNLLAGNPAALKRTFETGGRNLLSGLRHFADDLRNNGGLPAQVDRSAFAVGTNLALTPGRVVLRTEVFELIQYLPTTREVHARPLLFVPPQISRFYVLDLAPGRSLVEHCVKSGHTVFMISWRNPQPEHREWDLGVYVEAIREAIDAAADIATSDDVDLVGVCAGGVTTSVALGYLAARGRPRVHTLTFIVTVLDTSVPSMIGMFASEKSVASAIRRSRSRGILRGSDMARVFAWLRPNDLVWNYWVNNYLLGEAPPVFDVLAWNADVTNLPAALHAEFLSLFLENPLRRPGELQVRGRPIDLSVVNCDTYTVGAATDHITPWNAVYHTPSFFGGPGTFVLSSSGHIQAIVNPPGNSKSRFFVRAGSQAGIDAETWLKTAEEQAGSWWGHWMDWLAERSPGMRPAPGAAGDAAHPPLDAAPGLYVHEREGAAAKSSTR